MEIVEEDRLFEGTQLKNPQVDSRRLIIYDFPPTLNENGIYNILDNIECPPTNIILVSKRSSSSAQEGNEEEGEAKEDLEAANYVIEAKSTSVAIVEFSSKQIMDKAFYVISRQYKEFFEVQYAYRSNKSTDESHLPLSERSG